MPASIFITWCRYCIRWRVQAERRQASNCVFRVSNVSLPVQYHPPALQRLFGVRENPASMYVASPGFVLILETLLSCEVEDFVETRTSKLRVMLRSRVPRGVYEVLFCCLVPFVFCAFLLLVTVNSSRWRA